MKRLQCLYKPEKSKDYPWALKHPKVATALALFKTRQEATDWYLSLGYECVYWFQNQEKIWGGQVVSEKNLNGVMEHEVIVDNFDGALSYESTCEEFYIDPRSLTRDLEAQKLRLANLKDFKLLKDPEKYFPVEDIPSPRKSKKDLEIEELRRQIALLLDQLSTSKRDYSKEIIELQEQLKDSSSDKSALLQRVLELQKAERLAEEEENKAKIEAQNLVNLVKFAYIKDLSVRDQVEVLALYSEKVKELEENVTVAKTNTKDLNSIKANINLVRDNYEKLLKELKPEDPFYAQIKLLLEKLKHHSVNLVHQLVLDENAENTPLTSAYSKDLSTNTNLPLNLATSFVLYNMKHVAFTPFDKYEHAISVLHSIQDQRVIVLGGEITEHECPSETEVKEVLVTSQANEVVDADLDKRWSRLVLSVLGAAALILVILLVLILVFLT
ncbi:hypothetical protein V2E24_02480 [Mycoplasmopsis ciconiae]|uniref:Uncharacterized protein n=1 Tax=Mycoplasmopsis ciconiae TaxID=561067 RepID=A0ABU7MLM2_9BACT|nr:hypothetical protein [Mycoplasmopsis ciconiae]